MTGYRDTRLVCPGCAGLLEPEPVGESTIDVCPSCGGIWVDWFDGEIIRMAQGAPRSAPAGHATGGASACPRCHSALAREGYLDTGAAILRCADCVGAFVPREAVALLVNAGDRGTDQGAAPHGVLERLLEILRGWLTGNK